MPGRLWLSRGQNQGSTTMRARVFTLAAVLPLLCSASMLAWASPGAVDELTVGAPLDPARAAIERALDATVLQIGDVTLDTRDLQALYGDRAYFPLWTHDGGLDPRAHDIVAVLEGAGADGLLPADYYVTALDAALADPARVMDAELLLSAAVMRYGVDLHSGRVAPRDISRTFDIDPRAIDREAVAVAASLVPDPVAYLHGLAPQGHDYAVLKEALAQAHEEDAQVAEYPQVADGPSLRPGDASERVPVLRARLAASGDYVVETESGVDDEAASEVFDDDLVAAVKIFQERSGLTPDGIVGRNTLAALNAGAPTNRVDSLIATMERLRWLPDDLGDDYLLVNIPSFTLDIVKDDALVRQMDVIVGQTGRQTPLFNSALTYLEFNPTWTMPVSIATRDYLPRLRRDASYLDSHGFRVYAGWGSGGRVSSSYVDWHSGNIGGYRIVQQPGPSNALGKVKFMMANNWSVYLHDTPHHELFERDVRSLSSGCVRLSDPIWLADFLLDGASDWTPEKRERIMASWSPTTRVNLPAPMPLYITYETARVDPATGELVFRDDIYGFDKKVIEAVENRSATLSQVAALD
jgi:murein L,D-transpeptidase YcbB/YkuD